MHAEPRDISIRFAGPADRHDLMQLAQLDSAGQPRGDALVAVVDGRIRAALPLGGRVIADPFEPSSELASLLELRAEQLHAEAAHPPHRFRTLLDAMPVIGGHA